MKFSKISFPSLSEGDVLTCVKRKLSFSDKDAVGKDSPDIEILESNVKSACPPGPNLSSRDSNKPIMKLACPVASCDLKVPIFQDETSSETAQEIIYNHQRQVHNLSEPNLSTQGNLKKHNNGWVYIYSRWNRILDFLHFLVF